MKVQLVSLLLGISSFVISAYTQQDSFKRAIRPSHLDDTHTFFGTRSHSHVEYKNTKRNVHSALLALRLSKRANEFWTTEEDNLLLDLKAQGWPWKDIGNALPRRTERSAQQRLYNLQNKPLTPKKTRNPWTPGEDKLLQDLKVRGQPFKEITKSFPRRSQSAVEQRYHKITKSKKKIMHWTPEEEKRLLELAESGMSREEMAKQLPGRSPNAISRRYKHLVGDKQAEEDELIIQAVEEGKTWEEISQTLGKSESTARRRANQLEKLGRLTLTSELNQRYPYTDADLQLMHMMRENNVSWKKISKWFPGRSRSALQTRYYLYITGKEDEKKAPIDEVEDP